MGIPRGIPPSLRFRDSDKHESAAKFNCYFNFREDSMSNLYDEDEEKELLAEDEFVEADELILDSRIGSTSDARRRLENLLEEKRLREELDDFLDY